MFKSVWKWAGLYRRTGKNIGVPAERIPEELLKLCHDTEYWITNTTYSWDELGARFHHRLVWIHAFANGNGRHARLMTDVLLTVHQQEPFTWGAKRVTRGNGPSQVRVDYITALREADKKKFEKLIQFVKN
jgi:Fic-DOC domain mobile mystery protein B